MKIYYNNKTGCVTLCNDIKTNNLLEQDSSSSILPKSVMQGYLCGTEVNPEGDEITADQIYNSGFNYVLLCFFSISTDSTNGIKIEGNICCNNIEGYKDLANQLIDKGVNIGICIGGDGCSGYDDSIKTATDEQIITAFDKLREDLGIRFTGIDIDIEGFTGNINDRTTYIDKIGKALYLNKKDYFVTLAPTPEQFTPQGYNSNSLSPNWAVNLTPLYYKHVMIQWYEGGCVSGDTCPCWGSSDIIKDTCPKDPSSWDTNYSNELSTKCGIVDWIKAFSNRGNPKSSQWTTDKIVIGTKSWCGLVKPTKCSSDMDNGIWSADQIINIVDKLNSNIGGVSIWNVNDYYSPGYANTGNPVSSKCEFSNIVSNKLGIKSSSSTKKCTYNLTSSPCSSA